MLYHLVFAVGVIMTVFGGWLLVEELVRRKAPRRPEDCDESGEGHGCGHCLMADTCPMMNPEDGGKKAD